MSPTLNVNPTLFVIPCNFLGGGLYIYKVVVIVTHQVTFHPNFNLRDNISSQLADK